MMFTDYWAHVHWRDRSIDLRQFARLNRAFLASLQALHPVFGTFEHVCGWSLDQWNEGLPEPGTPLAPALANLDDIILRSAWSNTPLQEDRREEGGDPWRARSLRGFVACYVTTTTGSQGRVEIGITAGSDDLNIVWMRWPCEGNPDFPHREFYEAGFARRMLACMVAIWHPERGKLTSDRFDLALRGPSAAGWLTYLGKALAGTLRGDLQLDGYLVEDQPEDGILVALDGGWMAPANEAQVARGRRLAGRLADCGAARSKGAEDPASP